MRREGERERRRERRDRRRVRKGDRREEKTQRVREIERGSNDPVRTGYTAGSRAVFKSSTMII